MIAVALGPKNLSRIRIQGKRCKRCGLLIASRSDRMIKICFTPSDKVTLFETMMTS